MNEIEELLGELPKPKRRNGSVASRKRLRKQHKTDKNHNRSLQRRKEYTTPNGQIWKSI